MIDAGKEDYEVRSGCVVVMVIIFTLAALSVII